MLPARGRGLRQALQDRRGRGTLQHRRARAQPRAARSGERGPVKAAFTPSAWTRFRTERSAVLSASVPRAAVRERSSAGPTASTQTPFSWATAGLRRSPNSSDPARERETGIFLLSLIRSSSSSGRRLRRDRVGVRPWRRCCSAVILFLLVVRGRAFSAGRGGRVPCASCGSSFRGPRASPLSADQKHATFRRRSFAPRQRLLADLPPPAFLRHSHLALKAIGGDAADETAAGSERRYPGGSCTRPSAIDRGDPGARPALAAIRHPGGLGRFRVTPRPSTGPPSPPKTWWGINEACSPGSKGPGSSHPGTEHCARIR
jgi:hypothetical protein